MDDEEHLRMHGGLREEIGMNINMYGTMDYAYKSATPVGGK